MRRSCSEYHIPFLIGAGIPGYRIHPDNGRRGGGKAQVLIAKGPQQDGVLLRIGNVENKVRGQKDAGAGAAGVEICGHRAGASFAVDAARATAAEAGPADQHGPPSARMIGIVRKNPRISHLGLEIHIIRVCVAWIGQPAQLREQVLGDKGPQFCAQPRLVGPEGICGNGPRAG